MAQLAESDSSVKELCTQLSHVALFFTMNERRARELFATPVDPAFLATWREYEERYENAVIGVWLSDIGTLEVSQAPTVDSQWDVADDEAEEQAGGIEEAIDFAQFNVDQTWRRDDLGADFVEQVQEGIAAWDRLKWETGFDLRGVFRRRALIPFILVPRQVAAKHGTSETFSMLKNSAASHGSSPVPIAVVTVPRSCTA